MIASARSLPLPAAWVRRARLALAVALLWAILHFLLGSIVPRGLDRPIVLVASPQGPLAGALAIVALWTGAVAARLIAGGEDPRAPLQVVAFSLALWAAEGGRAGGTMDSWLILRRPEVGPPVGGPYWVLLADYLYLMIGVGGTMLVALRQSTPAGTAHRERYRGLVAMLVSTLIAGALMVVLMGRPAGQTLRGQVYFAVFLGVLAGVAIARRVTGVSAVLWYCPVPFLLGIMGLFVAGLAPGLMLPAVYRNLNNIPAWSLARALPIEMIGVGLLGAIWTLRPHPAGAAAGDH